MQAFRCFLVLRPAPADRPLAGAPASGPVGLVVCGLPSLFPFFHSPSTDASRCAARGLVWLAGPFLVLSNLIPLCRAWPSCPARKSLCLCVSVCVRVCVFCVSVGFAPIPSSFGSSLTPCQPQTLPSSTFDLSLHPQPSRQPLRPDEDCAAGSRKQCPLITVIVHQFVSLLTRRPSLHEGSAAASQPKKAPLRA